MKSERYIQKLTEFLSLQNYEIIDEMSEVLSQAWATGANVWIAGNGGNAANSLHFVTDWSKGLFVKTGKSMNVRSLVDNISLFSALTNDLAIEQVFSFQLSLVAKPGDVCVLMSAGGNSENIRLAADYCSRKEIMTLGLLGGSKPTLTGLFTKELHIPTDDIQIVEDIHAAFGHIVFKYINL
jgi:D-sedoheptulose 7-phosphate isomerase